jgi:bifunctional non-homologous end joining protein LigD
MGIIESIELFFKEGSSDKVYNLQLVQTGSNFRVDFQYGRRGSTLTTGSKVQDVDLTTARKAYNKVMGEKTGKGYQVMAGKSNGAFSTPVADIKKDTAWQSSDEFVPMPTRKFGSVKRVSAIPQQPHPIMEEDLDKYLNDDRYGTSEKKDGKSMMVYKNPGSFRATNKKGIDCGYPTDFEKGLANVDQIIANGEAIGQTLFLYDLLELDGEDLRPLGYQKRFERLSGLQFQEGCEIVPVAVGATEKRALYDKMVAEKREGVIFKLLDEPYTAGKTGSMLKLKLVDELSAKVVEGRPGKNSIGLELLDDNGSWQFMGYCTVSSAQMKMIVEKRFYANIVAEIRYLYCLKGGHLYQPCFKGIRDDIDLKECVMSQVKYKPD